MLGAYPWVSRPPDEPLTAEEVCEALWQAEGDIRQAALRLKVGSLVLRKFVERSTRARAVIREADACLVDEAGATLRQAIRDEDARRQDWATRFVLNSKNGRPSGWSTTDDAADAARLQGPIINLAPMIYQWQNGEKMGPPTEKEPVVIDVAPNPEPAPPSAEPPVGNQNR